MPSGKETLARTKWKPPKTATDVEQFESLHCEEIRLSGQIVGLKSGASNLTIIHFSVLFFVLLCYMEEILSACL